MHAASTAGKKGGLPAEQTLAGQWLGVVLRGIEHQLDGSLDIATRGDVVGGLNSHAPGDGGADRCRVKYRALDGAGFDDFRREILQRGFGAKTKSEAFHPTEQASLAVPDFHQGRQQFGLIPGEMRPFWSLMDIAHGKMVPNTCGEYKIYSPHDVRRIMTVFTANYFKLLIDNSII
jgi:hypothetical protein